MSIADGVGSLITTNTRIDEYGVPGASNLGMFQYTGQLYLPDLRMYYYKGEDILIRLGEISASGSDRA